MFWRIYNNKLVAQTVQIFGFILFFCFDRQDFISVHAINAINHKSQFYQSPGSSPIITCYSIMHASCEIVFNISRALSFFHVVHAMRALDCIAAWNLRKLIFAPNRKNEYSNSHFSLVEIYIYIPADWRNRSRAPVYYTNCAIAFGDVGWSRADCKLECETWLAFWSTQTEYTKGNAWLGRRGWPKLDEILSWRTHTFKQPPLSRTSHL